MTAACSSVPVVTPPISTIEDGRSTEPSPAPGGYSQFCRDTPTSPLC